MTQHINLHLHQVVEINEMLTSRFQLDPVVNLQLLVERCPAHMTGADLYALCSDAMTAAIKRKICLIDSGKKTGSQRTIQTRNRLRRFSTLSRSSLFRELFCLSIMSQGWIQRTRRSVSLWTTSLRRWKTSGRLFRRRSCCDTNTFNKN